MQTLRGYPLDYQESNYKVVAEQLVIIVIMLLLLVYSAYYVLSNSVMKSRFYVYLFATILNELQNKGYCL